METFRVETKSGVIVVKADNFIVTSERILYFHVIGHPSSVAAFNLNDTISCVQVDHIEEIKEGRPVNSS